MKGAATKRERKGFLNSEIPLASRRVRIILSNHKDSQKLLNAIRTERSKENNHTHFKISKNSQKKISEAE